MKNILQLFIILFFLQSVYASDYKTLKRSRAEACYLINSSNTIGAGNFWIRSSMSTFLETNNSFGLEPYAEGGMGLNDNFSLFVGSVFLEDGLKKIIGMVNVDLKLTLPNNDNFRLLGFAVTGGITLSTVMDTSNGNSGTPSFEPESRFGLLIDLDLLKYYKTLPLKLYLNISTADDKRMLTFYKQISSRIAVEYKASLMSSSLAIGFGKFFAKNNRSDLNDEFQFYGAPTFRYHWSSNYSVYVSSKILLFSSKIEENSEFITDQYSINFGIDFPLFYRETNTEARRAINLLELEKLSNKTKVVKNNNSTIKTNIQANNYGKEFLMQKEGKNFNSMINNYMKNDALDKQNVKEKEVLKNRKNINSELDKIERMLE